MKTKTLLLAIVYLATLSFSISRSSDACPVGWCTPWEPPVECVWNPTYSFCDINVNPHYPCECNLGHPPGIKGSCIPWIRIVSLTNVPTVAFTSDFGSRPGGQCADIPCGTCYQFLEDRACEQDFYCENPTGGSSCNAYDTPCMPFARPPIITDLWVSTGQDCCLDSL